MVTCVALCRSLKKTVCAFIIPLGLTDRYIVSIVIVDELGSRLPNYSNNNLIVSL